MDWIMQGDPLVRFPLYFFAHLLLSLAFLPIHTQITAQTAPALEKWVNPVDPEGILRQLAPDDVPPHSLAMKPAARARAIRLLVAVKRDETGWHRQLAVYLLATLGYDYARNREELLRVWRKDSDDGTMELLIRLYEQGHKEFLLPLLRDFNGNNVATSEGLGWFYGDLLEKNPRDFLTALATFPNRKQMDLCYAAGAEDGGGMSPKTERKVLANLKEIGSDVAISCARSVRSGNQDADEASQEEQREIQKENQKKQKK
jgi:hypothetical protein